MSTTPSFLARQPGTQKRQTKTLLWIGFGGLLLLLWILGASSLSFLYQVEVRHERIRQEYLQRDRVLEKLRAKIYVSGTYFRDFVLDAEDARAFPNREHFLRAEDDVLSEVEEYKRLLSPGEQKLFQDLRNELRAYFKVLTPALAWNSRQRLNRSYAFIQEQLLPRRMMAISLADRVQQSSQKQLERDGEAVSQMFSSFRTRLLIMLILAIAIGVSLAAITMWRLLHFERLSEGRFREVAEAQEESKQLSAKLVSAQEDERRRISRELHDEVGQVLSAMMLGVGSIRSSLSNGVDVDAALRQLQAIEEMTGRSTQAVRTLSLTLRPTMLDDLGLVAALKWLSREISRTSSLQVDVLADDTPDELPEEHRTCVYRVVQEALRNTSRHSGAHHACISVQSEGSLLRIAVQDDGKGFNSRFEKGMGILGMEERVERLGGSFHVDSEHGRGTTVFFELPLPEAIGRRQETNPLRTA